MTTITIATDSGNLDLPVDQLVVAGYTGRNRDAIDHHIAELAAIGVPEPDSVPAYYLLEAALVTTETDLAVGSASTSGEVEPVLIRHEGRYYLTVGSDHTDRDLERTGIALSKAACPKPIAAVAIDLGTEPSIAAWDAIEMRCRVDGELYQEGSLAQTRPLAEILAEGVEHGIGDTSLVLFGGTLPLIDGTFRYGSDWRMELHVPDHPALVLTYTTHEES